MPKFSAKYVSQLTVEKVLIISNTVILQIQGSIQWDLLNFVSVINNELFHTNPEYDVSLLDKATFIMGFAEFNIDN